MRINLVVTLSISAFRVLAAAECYMTNNSVECKEWVRKRIDVVALDAAKEIPSDSFGLTINVYIFEVFCLH